MHFNLPYSTIELKKSRLEILIGKFLVRVMVLHPKNQAFYFTHSSYVHVRKLQMKIVVGSGYALSTGGKMRVFMVKCRHS